MCFERYFVSGIISVVRNKWVGLIGNLEVVNMGEGFWMIID